MKTLVESAKAAKAASLELARLTTEAKNAALRAMARALMEKSPEILAANEADMQRGREGGMPESLLDRLMLNEARIAGMAEGLEQVADLPDPIGRVMDEWTRPNGLVIRKVRVPMGVIGIIYEARPNVTADAFALCFKAGNVVILRGGSDAFHSNQAIVDVIRGALGMEGIPEDAIQLIQDTSRETAQRFMQMDQYVNVLIPRGGAGLIRAVTENAKVPCIQTGTGICHVYVDKAADLSMALSIVENAKTSRPSVCNAEEVLLVHEAVAAEFLPRLKTRLVDDRAADGKVLVELRLCPRAAELIPGEIAGAQDFDTEFLDYILAVKVVDSLDEAIAHIAQHSTGHSEAIVTADQEAAARFTRLVDSAAVYVNCSTRFTDGGEFGLGCEMGISTQKLHARGPMGLEELCTYKYVIHGNGQVR